MHIALTSLCMRNSANKLEFVATTNRTIYLHASAKLVGTQTLGQYMSNDVLLPFWFVAILILFASLWLLQHFLLPSAKWFIRRRANNLIDEVNNKLALRIPSFKLTRREVLIDRLVYHDRVMAVVDELAEERDMPREALIREVQTYAREIVPAFNALVYFKAAYWVAKRLVHALYRVRHSRHGRVFCAT